MAYFNEKLTVAKDLSTLRGADVSTSGTIADLANDGFSFFRLTAATQLTSLVAAASGKELTITNANTADLLIKNESGTAANRILTGTGADSVLRPGASLTLKYDDAASRWRVTSALAAEGGRTLIYGQIDGKASVNYELIGPKTFLSVFGTSSTTANAPTIYYDPLGLAVGNITNLPAFDVTGLPPGVYEVGFTVFLFSATAAIEFTLGISDGVTDRMVYAANLLPSGNTTASASVSAFFHYTAPKGATRFQMLCALPAVTMLILNDNATFRAIPFFLKRYPL
jgi:hypothetical protein